MPQQYDLTEQLVSSTYSRLIQFVSGNFYDGLGNEVIISSSSSDAISSSYSLSSSYSDRSKISDSSNSSSYSISSSYSDRSKITDVSLTSTSSSYSISSSYSDRSKISDSAISSTSSSYSNTSSTSNTAISSSYAVSSSWSPPGNSVTSSYSLTSSHADFVPYFNTIGITVFTEDSYITAGSKGIRHIGFKSNISKIRAIANTSGSIDININRNNVLLGNIHISNNINLYDNTLVGWTTQLEEDDLIEFYVSGSSVYITDITIFMDIKARK